MFILTTKNFILSTSKLHPKYKDGGPKIFKNARFILIGGKFWENIGTGVIIIGQVLFNSSFDLH